LGLALQRAPACLETLLGMAQLCLHDGQVPLAIELLNLVSHHTAGRQEIKDRAVNLIDELKIVFSSEGTQTLCRRDPTFDLDAVIQQLLVELESQQTIPDLSVNQALRDPLSPRELEVMALIADGFKNREIADRL